MQTIKQVDNAKLNNFKFTKEVLFMLEKFSVTDTTVDLWASLIFVFVYIAMHLHNI
jgi:hypothetical protein